MTNDKLDYWDELDFWKNTYLAALKAGDGSDVAAGMANNAVDDFKAAKKRITSDENS